MYSTDYYSTEKCVPYHGDKNITSLIKGYLLAINFGGSAVKIELISLTVYWYSSKYCQIYLQWKVVVL